ncbi:MAG TPA: Ig-like domain-containing protein [Gemmatimonadaceae bacterium]|nr:Ig-like domain-containing protein [Gemmatimonadaceae bacterium]
MHPVAMTVVHTLALTLRRRAGRTTLMTSVALLLGILGLSCSTERLATEGEDPVTVSVTPATAALTVGDTRTLQVAVTPSSTPGTPTWGSSNDAVATVNGSGVVTAHTAGTARVTASLGSASGGSDITVTAPPPPPPPTVTSLVLAPPTVTMGTAATQQFTATEQLSNGTSRPASGATWTATGGVVTTSGLYTSGTVAGTFRVIATGTSGHADTSSVTVTAVPPPPPTVTSLVLSPASATLATSATQQFTATEQLSNGTSRAASGVTWSATGGTVSTSGLYTAGGTGGSYRVIARGTTGHADTASITINAPPPPPPTVTALVLTPASATLSVSATQQFTATEQLSNGTSRAASGVAWSATGGTVSASGLYTAGTSGGSYRVIARGTTGHADTSAITINAPPPPPTVTALVVAPASASLTTGGTQQFTATEQLSNGTSRAASGATWSATGGTVSSAGLYTAGTTAGSFRVIATGTTGHADTSSITITAPGTGAPTNECASPRAGWIWCDDFEQDRLGSYFEMDNAGGGFARATGVGRNGSPGIRIRYAAGQVEGGNLKLAFGRTPNAYFRPVDAGTANYREVYWRMYLRAQPGWTGGAGWKWTRAIVFANANWAEAAIGHVSSFWENDFLTNGPVRGTDEAGNLVTTRYNDFDNFVYLGQVDGVTPIYASNRVGQWYCVEAHMRLNDAGQSNGILEFWIDGNVEARQASLNFLGSFNAYAINAIFFENYWNGGSPQVQERYWDNIVVSTQRIGC